MSKWSEIRNDFNDGENISIDAWKTSDDMEEGKVIARVSVNDKTVEYLDDDARNDAYAQEVIAATIAAL